MRYCQSSPNFGQGFILHMNYLTHTLLLEKILGWLAGISLVTFFLSLLLIPFIVGLLAPDYFLKLAEPRRRSRPLSPWSLVVLLIRNLLGLFLVLAGIAMLFLPGQGLLTILLGILLLSLPGKNRLVNRLVSIRGVRRSFDWLREKGRKPPFIWPETKNDSARRS